jgi:hypothetical protein
MELNYQYSMITPCYCQSARMYMENITPPRIKLTLPSNSICGDIIEKRYETDKLGREHIKIINHCLTCKNKSL